MQAVLLEARKASYIHSTVLQAVQKLLGLHGHIAKALAKGTGLPALPWEIPGGLGMVLENGRRDWRRVGVQ